jgi:hypothetical protein
MSFARLEREHLHVHQEAAGRRSKKSKNPKAWHPVPKVDPISSQTRQRQAARLEGCDNVVTGNTRWPREHSHFLFDQRA